MPRRPATLLIPLLACVFPAAALAQSTGEMILTVAGEERIIPIWSEQSDWSGSENWPSISIFARDVSDDAAEPALVTLGFEAPSWQPGAPEMELVLYESRQRVGSLHAREEEDRGGLTVTLDSHSIDDSRLSLNGSFEGVMGPSDNHGRDIDLSRGVPVSGTFAVTLEALE